MHARRLLELRLLLAAQRVTVLVERRRRGGKVAQRVDVRAAHALALDGGVDLFATHAERQVRLVLCAVRGPNV